MKEEVLCLDKDALRRGICHWRYMGSHIRQSLRRKLTRRPNARQLLLETANYYEYRIKQGSDSTRRQKESACITDENNRNTTTTRASYRTAHDVELAECRKQQRSGS